MDDLKTISSNCIVKNSKDQGNYVVASKDIKAGDFIVFREKPYSCCINFKIEENEKKICHYCFTINNNNNLNNNIHNMHTDNFIICNNCKLNWYCSEKCKNEDYQTSHQYECKIWKKIQSASQFNNECKTTIKLLIKILILQYNEIKINNNNDNNDNNNSYKEIKFKDIIGLESNSNKFSTQRITDFMKISKFIEKSVDKEIIDTIYPTVKEMSLFQKNMIKLMCILECNSHDISFPFRTNSSITTFNYYSIGIGIYFNSSLFNHSCQPNICKVIESCKNNFGCHSMVAIRDIKENEEISFNYIQLNQNKQERIEKLQSSYYFTCNCPSCCTNNPNPHKEFLNKYKCKKLNCSGLEYPNNNNNNNNNLICNICLPINFN
ncbi:hypothetical protein DICPUDRAFT_34471 [Dictyostelium purpureum]|uniref:SET domain-containing protein n=1 Tax=Dictyostelium purpureum TaxID=5786 RepID=F0ZMP1_DICPU|nr:uncharacterized protein DICPUDRAFT_34471 [Dictyostelium purpureum]EGC34766.1 hypothetical protein DICPUDRAFT_34471 [Dictyostelium purpureum]|eukprot:XP_003288681.1 hypothetical protein DICPUDRAFT_34471 [Dictyostelium purpureum]